MLQNWFIFTIIAGFSSNVFNYINRYVLKDDNDSTAYAWWFEFFRLLIFLPFFILTFNFPFTVSNLLLFALIGISEFFSVYFYMKMHSQSELSISSTVTQLRLVWVPLFALLLLKEKLEGLEYFGVFMIFVGQVVTTLKKNVTSDKGIKSAFIASIFIALNNIVFKIAAGKFAAPVITVAMTIPTLVFFPMRMNGGKERIVALGKKKWRKILLASMSNAVSMLFLIWALSLGPVGKVTAVFQSMMIVQVFVGIFLLNEKENVTKKVLGSIAVIAGIILLV